MCINKQCLSFPGGAAGKESACNAGDPFSIPGSGRSPGEGIGNPLQSSWASLVAQLVNNLPAMWETLVRSLGWEDPLEKEMAAHSSIFLTNLGSNSLSVLDMAEFSKFFVNANLHSTKPL